HVIEENARVGHDDALNARMADVPLVPKRDVFEGGERVAAHHARESTELLTGDRVALVRHGRASFLTCGKVFLSLQDLCSLQMPKLRGPPIHACGNEGQCRLEFRVPVALYDLCAERGRFKAKV